MKNIVNHLRGTPFLFLTFKIKDKTMFLEMKLHPHNDRT